MSRGITLCGKGQIREACSAFDLALKLATGDSATHHLLYLIKAIATFNTNAQEKAIMCINDMAKVSLCADLLACNVVQAYFYAQMGLTALTGNINNKAVKYITAAIEIATSCSLQTVDFSMYAEFVVIFGWDLESSWQNINMYNCLILFRACRIEALECYRTLVDACDEAQKVNLLAWFSTYNNAGCLLSTPQPAPMRC